MKSLKPSLRENKRYLLVRGKNLKANIEKAISDFLGVRGMYKVGLGWIKTEYPNNQNVTGGHEQDSIIICVNREAVDLVRASLVVWPEKMETLKVSGTLKGLKK